MFHARDTGHENLEQRFHQIRCRVRHLVNESPRPCHVDHHVDGIRDLLSALSLNAEDHARATRHLDNASQYFFAGEHGAAHYELHLLEGVCSHHAARALESVALHAAATPLCPAWSSSGNPL